MPKYLTNSFSFNMLHMNVRVLITAQRVGIDAARAFMADPAVVTAIGHADTAAVVGSLLGRPVAANRATLQLGVGDALLVAQYVGPRLPEGATTLPEGAKIDFIQVYIS